MAAEQEQFESCAECGATIYPEHLQKHIAEQFEGRLLCVHCLKDKRGAAAGGAASPRDEPIPIALADVAESSGGGLAYDRKPTIRSIGGGPGGMTEGQASEKQYRRPLQRDAATATRARVFHTKLADAALVHMCAQINEWADANDDIQIKFATSCIGVVEGKHADPHLIVTVFY